MKIKLPDRQIAYNRCLVNIGAGIKGAIFLSQAIYWSNRTTQPDGSFYKTMSEFSDETGLTIYDIKIVRKKLKELGILIEKRARIQHTTFYKIDVDVLESILGIDIKNNQTKTTKSNDKKVVKDKLLTDNSFSDKEKYAIEKWLVYKSEKNQSYKQTGLNTLIDNLIQRKKEGINIIESIEYSIANNWTGIYDKTDNIKNNYKYKSTNPTHNPNNSSNKNYKYKDFEEWK